MRNSPAAFILAIVMLIWSCSSASESAPVLLDTGTADLGPLQTDTEPLLPDGGLGLDLADGMTADFGADAGLDSIEPGAFGWPCSDEDDCTSGYCVESHSGQVCTSTCVTECPQGWQCVQDMGAAPDLVFVCLPEFLSLCMPCTTHLECYSSGIDTGARCVDAGSQGAFCGAECEEIGVCPGGYECVEADLISGQTAMQCVPADSGECECSEFAIYKSSWTNCFAENEDGVCPGTRNCSEEGLTDCDAPIPAPEECNGIDDNCNEEVDEDLGKTGCGVGVCAHTVDNCVDGSPVECDPLEGAGTELCNGTDDNCDGATDEGYQDTDEDGVADCLTEDDDGDGIPDGLDNCPSIANEDQEDFDLDTVGDACDPDDDNDQVADEEDCEPFNVGVHPGAPELCNGIDDNCDGEQDEGMGETSCGLGECEHTVDNCEDGELAICNPFEGSEPETCDGLDNDCDGDIDENLEDLDQDGLVDCNDPDDDNDGILDVDDNCPVLANPEQLDNDEDGVGDLCDDDDDNDGENDVNDCEPMNPDVSHLAAEACNGVDDDCDFAIDEDGAEGCQTYYLDLDQDGFGVQEESKCLCEPGNLYTAIEAGDCKPLDETIYPGVEEVCNGEDDDCDGLADNGFPDLDDDHVADCVDDDDDDDGLEDLVDNCPATPNSDQTDIDDDGQGDACDDDDDNDGFDDLDDCQPQDPTAFPGAPELCNGEDDDCDGADDEEMGTTTCGLGPCEHTVENCPEGVPQICDPLEGAVDEVCDGVDNDCDGDVDLDAMDGQPWYGDGDGDGYGNPLIAVVACEAPDFYVANGDDCNDTDPSHFPGADEECDGDDNNCDGQVDEGYPDSDDDGELDCLDVDDDNDGVLDSQDCEPLNPAVPSCDGKVCGDDGCGDSCGSCQGNYTCQGGACVCQPNCSGKQCGPDGCGGSCGGCPANHNCNGNGNCICQPNCSGKQCGSDGCGGSCGGCSWGYYCSGSQCKCGPSPHWKWSGGQCKGSCGKLLSYYGLPDDGAGCCSGGCKAQQAGGQWAAWDCKHCCASWNGGGGCN